MISVVGVFGDDAAASRFLEKLAEDGVNPGRIEVSEHEGETRISVAVEEADADSTLSDIERHGADAVSVDHTVPRPGTTGRPTLTDPEPPPPHRSG